MIGDEEMGIGGLWALNLFNPQAGWVTGFLVLRHRAKDGERLEFEPFKIGDPVLNVVVTRHVPSRQPA